MVELSLLLVSLANLKNLIVEIYEVRDDVDIRGALANLIRKVEAIVLGQPIIPETLKVKYEVYVPIPFTWKNCAFPCQISKSSMLSKKMH